MQSKSIDNIQSEVVGVAGEGEEDERTNNEKLPIDKLIILSQLQAYNPLICHRQWTVISNVNKASNRVVRGVWAESSGKVSFFVFELMFLVFSDRNEVRQGKMFCRIQSMKNVYR